MCKCAVDLCKFKPPGGGNEVLVAVKRLLPSILKNKEELLAFVEETKLLRKLRHKYCPAQFDMATSEHHQNPLVPICSLIWPASLDPIRCAYRPCPTCVKWQAIPSMVPAADVYQRYIRHMCGALTRLCTCRYIVSYIGVGGSGEMSLRNAESAKKVLNSTFLVQEYVEGGNLRKQVLEQVCWPDPTP